MANNCQVQFSGPVALWWQPLYSSKFAAQQVPRFGRPVVLCKRPLNQPACHCARNQRRHIQYIRTILARQIDSQRPVSLCLDWQPSWICAQNQVKDVSLCLLLSPAVRLSCLLFLFDAHVPLSKWLSNDSPIARATACSTWFSWHYSANHNYPHMTGPSHHR